MKISLAYAGIFIVLGASVAAHAQSTSLRAGAAKVDVTPSASELPKTYDGILDHLYARAIVLESGNAGAALITVDAGGVPDAVWKASQRASGEDPGNTGAKRTPDRDAHAQRAGTDGARLHPQDRRVGTAGERASHSGARWIRHRRLSYINAIATSSTQNEAVVGRAEL